MKKKKNLRIIPLGGLEEIGKNMTVIEYGDDIILIDAGMGFPEDELLGIDIVIPDMTYIEKNRDRIKGIIFTHGHMDHIGSLSFILEKFKVPIYATKLTLGLIEVQLEESSVNFEDIDAHEINPDDIFSLGVFEIDVIKGSHSIPDAVGFAIRTPVGVLIHTGDFKIDYTPIDDRMIDLNKFAKYGQEGVLAMFADSTNVMREGNTMSERTVGETFDNIFRHTDERIIVASFSSNVHRVQQIINAAHLNNRKVAFSGRSMQNVSQVAMDLGYLKVPDDIIVDIKDMDGYPDNEICLVTTGSQGETFSALPRMAKNMHRDFELRKGDLVILSSTPIPGNEKSVNEIINLLNKKGVKVIYQSLADVHVSGHACKQELKLMHSLVKPKFFIPVHGEYSHLKHHAELAEDLGMPSKNIFILQNGDILEMNSYDANVKGKVPAGRIFVDGLGVGDVGNIVLRDRRILSEDGLMVVIIKMNSRERKIHKHPDIISRGFVYVRESEDLIEGSSEIAYKKVKEFLKKDKTDWNTIKKGVIRDLNNYLYSETKRRPMILPIIVEC